MFQHVINLLKSATSLRLQYQCNIDFGLNAYGAPLDVRLLKCFKRFDRSAM